MVQHIGSVQSLISGILDVGKTCNGLHLLAPSLLQMKLWVQAKQMGCYAAKCMFAHQTGDKSLQMDFCFEMFSHVTSFFGFKVSPSAVTAVNCVIKS